MPDDLGLVERLGLTAEQAAQLTLMDAAWVPKSDLAALADQRDALMAERTNLIETKRQQLAAKDAAIERLLAERDDAFETCAKIADAVLEDIKRNPHDFGPIDAGGATAAEKIGAVIRARQALQETP